MRTELASIATPVWMLYFILTSLGVKTTRSSVKLHASMYSFQQRRYKLNFLAVKLRFWKRASVNAPQATQERFVTFWRFYLDSVIIQAQRRDCSRYICTLEECKIARRDNIGTLPSFVFLEICLGLDIPHSVMEHPYIVKLHQDVTDMITFGNVSLIYIYDTE
jgi:hypothetical protein